MKRSNLLLLNGLLWGGAIFGQSCLAASPPRPSPASQREITISTDPEVAVRLKQALGINEAPVQLKKSLISGVTQPVLLKLKADQLEAVSHLIHREFHRCGGFMVEADQASLAELSPDSASLVSFEREKNLYQINQQPLVQKLAAQVSEAHLIATIKSMSAGPNRYYRSTHGKASQLWLKDQWQALTQGNPAVKVELFTHRDYPQPSVILTWTGSTKPEEVIVLGGHGDSIAGFMSGDNAQAPGADDNASGIATITEVLRLLSAGNFRPERTLQFISYAAEEVGLRGSADIARQYKERKVNVQGVMQLDMVNYYDGKNDIVLITDNTDNEQNKFIKNLVENELEKHPLSPV
jgi:leucyl aminopeptidase